MAYRGLSKGGLRTGLNMSLSVFLWSVQVSFWCQLYDGSQGEGSQGDGQELPPSLFHVHLVLHCYSHIQTIVDSCSSRIIPKIPIPTVLICELCSSQRDLLIIPGSKYCPLTPRPSPNKCQNQ